MLTPLSWGGLVAAVLGEGDLSLDPLQRCTLGVPQLTHELLRAVGPQDLEVTRNLTQRDLGSTGAAVGDCEISRLAVAQGERRGDLRGVDLHKAGDRKSVG